MPYRVLPGGASSSRVYLVDGGGNGDFQTIQAALNAAHSQSPAAANRWLVLVGPGSYSESLTLYNYVDLSGLAPGPAAIVNGPSGYSAVSTPASCWLSNLRLSAQSDPVLLLNTALIEMLMDMVVIEESTPGIGGIKVTAACTLVMRSCDIQAGGNGLRTGAGTVRAYNSRLAHSHAVSGAATEYAVRVDGGTLVLDKCVVENTSPAGTGVYFSANPTSAKVLHCTVRKASGSYAVDAAVSCANAAVYASALNAAVHSNIGVSAGNTVDAGV
jgi:hypothetical protein